MAGTLQIWLTEDETDMWTRIKQYYDRRQEEEFDGRAYRVERFSRRHGGRVKRKRINNSYVFREVLSHFWVEKEQEIVKSEKHR